MFEELLNLIFISLLSFGEAIIIPIPPDTLLIFYSYYTPKLWFLYSTTALIFSLIGGVVGYEIGNKFNERIRKFVGDKNINFVEKIYKKYGNYAVFIAGFSPIPYKVFTISSGILKYDIKKFLIYSLLSRATRFYLVSYTTATYGKEVVEEIINDPLLVFLSIVAAIVITYILEKIIRYLNNWNIN